MATTWNISKIPALSRMRFETTGTSVDLSVIHTGDYANIFGNVFNSLNRGSFEIVNVEFYYSGLTLTQAFEIENNDGVAEVVIQTINDDLQFFRPVVSNISAAGGRTVVLSSTEPGKFEVILPATTDTVDRAIKTGSYLHANESVSIKRVHRAKNGLTTVYYDGTISPVLSVNDKVFLDNVETAAYKPFVSNGVPGTYPAVATANACAVDHSSFLQIPTTGVNRVNAAVAKGDNGDAVIVGGVEVNAGVYGLTGTSKFRLNSPTVVADGTLADGANRRNYQWVANACTAGQLPSVGYVETGSFIGSLFIYGGIQYNNTGLGLSGRVLPYSAPGQLYRSSTNSMFSTIGAKENVGSGVVTLGNKVLVIGGVEATTGVGAVFYQTARTDCYYWDGGTFTWDVSPVVDLNEARAFFTTTKLQDGKVLIAGGRTLAREIPDDDNVLAHWKLNELSGTALADSIGDYPLTATGGTGIVEGSKISTARKFGSSNTAAPAAATSISNFASGAGDANVAPALLGDWTVEWWSTGSDSNNFLTDMGGGTIVGYGQVSEGVSANNTLMHIYFDSGSLKVRWEQGLGSDINAISAPIVDSIDEYYNHFAVRKTVEGGGNCTVDVFLNGRKIQTATGVFPPTGGGSLSSLWYISRNPDDGSAVTGFTGIIDDLRISKVARSDFEIAMNYFRTCGSIQSAEHSGVQKPGMLLDSCEIFDPNTVTMSNTGRMMLARTGHSATLLPDGRVLVVGGMAYNATSFYSRLVDPTSDLLWGPSESTNQCEIYNPNSGRWEKISPAGVKRHNHTAIYLSDRNQVMIVGGTSTFDDDVGIVEYLDLNTMTWHVSIAEMPTYTGQAVLLNDNATIFALSDEFDGNDSSKEHMLLALEEQDVSNGDLNGMHTVTAVGSGEFSFNSLTKSFSDSFGKSDNTAATDVVAAVRATNKTTLYFGLFNNPYSVGDLVYVNLHNNATFSSGVKLITAIGANAVTYNETASDAPSQAATGTVFKDYSTTDTAVSTKAVSDEIPGPYIFNPVDGVGITGIQSSIVLPSTNPPLQQISKGQKYSILPVTDATVFPDEEGFIVINFGSDTQTEPIRYFGRYNNVALMIDLNYTFKNNISNGSEVILLNQRDPFVPDTLVGGFYATDSAAGRVAAVSTVQNVAAAGIDITTKIVYPGDRGLGNEGYPASGSTKLSDKVSVWGGDDLDKEIADLKDD